MFWAPICKKFGNGTHIRNIGGAKKNQCAVPPRLITLIGFCRLRGCQSHHRQHSHKKTSGALSKNRTCDSSLPRTCFTTRLLGQSLPANYKGCAQKIKDKKSRMNAGFVQQRKTILFVIRYSNLPHFSPTFSDETSFHHQPYHPLPQPPVRTYRFRMIFLF